MKSEFPFLQTGVIYLDNAASTQKPQAVLDELSQFYVSSYANVHRGIHRLADKATVAYEGARKTVANFLGAPNEKNIIFTSGTTQALNMLAAGLGIQEHDIIILTELEHHSNLVPWQQHAQKVGATIKWIPAQNGHLDMDAAERIISEGCSILAVSHLSNVTGSLQDVQTLAKLVHEQQGIIIVDGAQAVAHIAVNVQELGVDAYAFSGHKLYGPTGIGAVYVHTNLYRHLQPFIYGGEMVDRVTKEKTTFASAPHGFEAGTPPIAQAVGLGAAIKWVKAHEEEKDAIHHLVNYAYDQLVKLPFINIIGNPDKTGLVSFIVESIHPHDVAQFLDTKNIAIRAGHHCCQVLHESLGIVASCRVSFGIYNTQEDVDALIIALKECVEAFHV